MDALNRVGQPDFFRRYPASNIFQQSFLANRFFNPNLMRRMNILYCVKKTYVFRIIFLKPSVYGRPKCKFGVDEFCIRFFPTLSHIFVKNLRKKLRVTRIRFIQTRPYEVCLNFHFTSGLGRQNSVQIYLI